MRSSRPEVVAFSAKFDWNRTVNRLRHVQLEEADNLFEHPYDDVNGKGRSEDKCFCSVLRSNFYFHII